MQIKIQKLDARATFAKAKPGDAGWDLSLCSVYFDQSAELWVGSLGVIVEPPKGYFFQLVARSSLAILGWRIANGVGIIDEGYRGTWCAILEPRSNERGALPVHQSYPSNADLYQHFADKLIGRRICQAILLPRVEAEVTEALPSTTERGTAGFGSTGA